MKTTTDKTRVKRALSGASVLALAGLALAAPGAGAVTQDQGPVGNGKPSPSVAQLTALTGAEAQLASRPEPSAQSASRPEPSVAQLTALTGAEPQVASRPEPSVAQLTALPGPASEPAPGPASPAVADAGIDWGDVAVGAGGAVGLIAVLGAMFALVRHQPTVRPSSR